MKDRELPQIAGGNFSCGLASPTLLNVAAGPKVVRCKRFQAGREKCNLIALRNESYRRSKCGESCWTRPKWRMKRVCLCNFKMRQRDNKVGQNMCGWQNKQVREKSALICILSVGFRAKGSFFFLYSTTLPCYYSIPYLNLSWTLYIHHHAIQFVDAAFLYRIHTVFI